MYLAPFEERLRSLEQALSERLGLSESDLSFFFAQRDWFRGRGVCIPCHEQKFKRKKKEKTWKPE